MERRRLGDMFSSMPLAHQVTIGIAVAVLGMAAFLFFQWVSTPSYTVLYTNLDDTTLSTVVDELERQSIPYRIEGGGTRVLVPKSQVFRVRGDLAVAGVQSGSVPQGYELLDGQGLNVSDFRQRIDYQRALEGELARTLLAMNDISMAQVHLVIPEQTLFAEDEEAVTASVLIDSTRPLGQLDVESVTFVIASAVEGLEAQNVTVADVNGQVLHAAGEVSGGAAVNDRNLRMTRDYETRLATDVRNLLATVVGANSASVVVRADLDFDEQSVETETYDPESSTALREQTIDEQFSGAGTPPGGTLGVEGNEIVADESDTYTYDRSEVIREYGVDRVISREVTAPGSVNQLSVAVVMDDGSLTGFPVPEVAEIESLVAAAVGLDAARGDTISVSTVAFPAPEDVEAAAAAAAAAAATPVEEPLDIMSLIPQAVGAIVLILVALALMVMSRGGKRKGKTVAIEEPPSAALTQGESGGEERELASVGAPSERGLQPEVMNLVQRQPEEIAVLLRSWLADRR